MQLSLFSAPPRHVWRTTELRAATALRADGLTAAQIALRLGGSLSPAAVQKRLERVGARVYGQP